MSISFWYSDVLYTSEVLEIVRNGKTSIFLLILLNFSAAEPWRIEDHTSNNKTRKQQPNE